MSRRRILYAGVVVALLLDTFVYFKPSKPALGYILRPPYKACADEPYYRIIYVHLSKDGTLMLNTERVELTELSERLYDIYRSRADRVIYFSADTDVRFQKIADTLDLIKNLHDSSRTERLQMDVILMTPGTQDACIEWMKRNPPQGPPRRLR
jgi:Biopolymer transport protein ExbD/TolR